MPFPRSSGILLHPTSFPVGLVLGIWVWKLIGLLIFSKIVSSNIGKFYR
jgi:hypothetical protein